MPFIEIGSSKILFVHIPRTGGTTIEQWLRMQSKLRLFTYGIPPSMRITPQHLTRNDLEDILGSEFFHYKFALVRNPFHRIESEYKLHALRGHQGFYGGFTGFTTWLEANLDAVSNNRHHGDNHFRPQTDFLGDDVEVFKFENGIESAIRLVASRFGLALPPEDVKKYNTEAYPNEIVWDSVSRERVRDYYRLDFELLGYSKDMMA